jgi:hypothetical protein
MSNMAKFVTAFVSLLALVIVASRQLFLLVAIRDPRGVLNSPAGKYHLWLSIGAGIAACIAASLMFRFFSRHEKNKWSKVEMTPTGPLLPMIALNPSNSTTASPIGATLRAALATSWLSEGQADDRAPMDGSVTESGETPSGQRAFARRTHQLMFKKWSQTRHD